MHPAQRRALLAMLTGMEQQLMTLKSLLFDDVAPSTSKPQPSAAEQAYMTDAEDEQLAEMMERERLAGLKEHERQVAAIWAGVQQE